MPLSPALWGASLCCALGGAFAGNSFGSAPVVGFTDASAYVAEHETASPVKDSQERADLPDHYPLVTREGVVPVEQLSDRGLYAQARYRSSYPAMDEVRPLPALAYVDAPSPTPESRPYAEAQPASRTGPVADSESDHVEPLALSRPAVIAASGHAKTVKVEAALALN